MIVVLLDSSTGRSSSSLVCSKLSQMIMSLLLFLDMKLPTQSYRMEYVFQSSILACKTSSNHILFATNRALSNYASVPVNNNLKSRLWARKYSKCMKTWQEASTSGYCSRELKRKTKVVYLPVKYIGIAFTGRSYKGGWWDGEKRRGGGGGWGRAGSSFLPEYS